MNPSQQNPTAWSDAQREVLAGRAGPDGRVLNIFGTVARNPQAAKAFLGWGGYVRRTPMSEREREIVILRIGWLCRAGYEWVQHSRLGRAAGLTDDDLQRLKGPPGSPGWSPREAMLVQAADELHADYFISDETWQALSDMMDESERMDLVYLVGHYTQVCMILNTFGIQVEAGARLDDDFRAGLATSDAAAER